MPTTDCISQQSQLIAEEICGEEDEYRFSFFLVDPFIAFLLPCAFKIKIIVIGRNIEMNWFHLWDIFTSHEATLIAILLAIIGLIVQLRIMNNQIRFQAMMQFGEQYRDAYANIADVIKSSQINSNIDAFDDESRAAFIRNCRELFRIFSLEYHAWELGNIHSKTWRIWKISKNQTFSSEIIQQAWREIGPEFSYHAPFQKFINNTIATIEGELKKQPRTVPHRERNRPAA